MKQIFGANWRTAILGYGSALFAILLPFLENSNFSFHRDWKNIVIAVGCAVFGNVAKDAKVTGLPDAPNNK